jgi:DNA-binding PadR family transcriptional regulator
MSSQEVDDPPKRPRKSYNRLRVLAAVADRTQHEDERGIHGYLLTKRTGIKSGRLYPCLAALTKEELIVVEHEVGSRHELGHPPRTFYRITDAGLRELVSETAPFVPVVSNVARPNLMPAPD